MQSTIKWRIKRNVSGDLTWLIITFAKSVGMSRWKESLTSSLRVSVYTQRGSSLQLHERSPGLAKISYVIFEYYKAFHFFQFFRIMKGIVMIRSFKMSIRGILIHMVFIIINKGHISGMYGEFSTYLRTWSFWCRIHHGEMLSFFIGDWYSSYGSSKPKKVWKFADLQAKT